MVGVPTLRSLTHLPPEEQERRVHGMIHPKAHSRAYVPWHGYTAVLCEELRLASAKTHERVLNARGAGHRYLLPVLKFAGRIQLDKFNIW